MTKKKITELIADIRNKIYIAPSDSYMDWDYIPAWNPIEEFIHCVSQKELCHSRILAQFFNPKGPHGDGPVYLYRFLELNGVVNNDTSDYEWECLDDVVVTTERSIESGRKIDIFIEWKEPNGQKRGVIVENKLNGAIYQPNQLEDYREAIIKEGYSDVKVIALHINEKPQDTLIKADSIIYASELVCELFDYMLQEYFETPPDVLYSHIGSILPYRNYLLSLSLNNAKMDIAKQILDLDSTTLNNLATLVQAFSQLNDAKNQWILDQVKQDFPDVTCETGSQQISFWLPEDYKRNGCWVSVHYPKKPEYDARGTDVWLVCKPENITDAKVIAKRLGLDFNGEYQYKKNVMAYWFRKPEHFRFSFFTERHELVSSIKEMLKVLSE
ncbi:PD-(D/E)XK nuclease family protein [bacterium]|nr:PD-(D/E)XK nuclease family protein [bacterium]